ncbi:hypothetical protein DFH06DRAFT_1351886 [Mycena polygramma]|nr:hypothetical protein DFH06DRAFT_1351886 [Mycena polygramma]
MATTIPPPMATPDLVYYAKSLIKENTYYVRHATDCVQGPDGYTWIEPLTATIPASSSPNASTAPAAPSPTRPKKHVQSRRSPDRYTRTSRKRSHSRSPPRHREYEHEYDRMQGHGHRTGPQHYVASRYRPRPREEGSRRGGYSDARECADRRSSPRHSPTTPQHREESSSTHARRTTTTPGASTSTTQQPLSEPSTFVAVTPPKIEDALKGVHSHPCFPGPSSAQAAVLGPGAAARTLAYKKKEGKRLRTVGKRTPPLPGTTTRTSEPRSASDLGLWYSLEIHGLAAAVNALRWANAGEPTARRFILRIEQEFGTNSSTARNEGVAHIMGQQANSRRAYLLATMGTSPAAKTRRSKSPFEDNELTADDELPDPPKPKTEDVDMTGSPYLGMSPPGGDEDIFPNSTSTVADTITVYQLKLTSSWPPGMRGVSGDYPTLSYEVPLEDDVLAVLTLLHLCPADDGTEDGHAAHTTFMGKAMLLFSVRGLYAHYVQLGSLRLGAYPIHDNYNFGTSALTFTQTASWFCAHGIASNSTACDSMEAYACSYRNQLANKTDPKGTEFAEWPQNRDCVAKVTFDDITPWSALEHAELRPGKESTYPRRPSAVHDDDMGVPEF